MKLKVEEQTKKTDNVKKEVIGLRKKISRLKCMNSNLTIGVPMNKVDVRQRKHSDDTLSLSDTRSSSGSVR